MELSTTVLSAQTLLATLESKQLRRIISSIGTTAGNQYLVIKSTLSNITPLLKDAEFSKYDLSREAQTWFNELKDIVFEASDLFDEFITLAKQNQFLKPEKGWPRFSRATNTRGNKAFSQVFEKITKRLEALDNTVFSITSYDHDHIKQRGIVSESYVKATDIIGRDDDLNNIVGMLLDPNVQHNLLSFLPIVGIGGIGKTTLAQLVYIDTRIMNAFPLMLWTCISDQNQKELDVKEIFGKILGQNLDNCTMEWVHKNLSQKLSSTRYLLVLDDVWTEDRENWLKLAAFLKGGQRGNWVIVTTRSEKTARVVGNGLMYKLQGLSKESSWKLFERMTFESALSNSPPVDRVKIGRQIIDRCAQVPLAIREMGRLLRGLDTSEWLSFRVNSKEFISTWKLSYDHLASPLKSCFQYCALFPKGFEFEKEMLISLWMAQGYLIIPIGGNESIEDIGEEYMSIFLDRYIFQDIKKNKLGDIVSFKMHNLMHDVAVSVADEEIYATSTFTGNDNLDRKIYHVSVTGEGHSDYSFANTRIYSYLHVGYKGLKKEKANKTFFESVIESCRYLKTLDLSGLMIHSLPESLGDLIHIRYLNLSDNIDLHVLPVSITNLHNLQTLYLRRCSSLIELPKDLGRLVNLRTLDISSCNKISSMPRDMDKMTCLCKLSDFVVDVKADYSSLSKYFEGFKELKRLNNLKGCLNIHIMWRKDVMMVVKEDCDRKGSYLKSKERINTLNFDFQHDLGDERVKNENVRIVMEELEPHSNLKVLEVKKYHGSRMPSWIAFLSNLVELHLVNCGELEYLPCLGNLIHLKVLKLMMLAELEYIGEDDQTADSSSTPDPELVSAERSSYLPCLETLELSNLPKLKAWRPKGKGDDHLLEESCSNKKIGPCFSELKLMFLWDCPELTYIPFCPSVEELKLINFNERLRIMDNTGNFEELRDVDSASTSAPCRQHGTTRIKKVAISNVGWLGLLPMQAFRFLEKMDIWCDKEVQSLTEVKQVFCSCSSSLRILTVHNCRNIRSVVSGGLKHLTALKELHIRNCDNLSLSEEIEVKESEDGIGMAHQFSYHSLQILTLQGLPQLENLPDWIQFFPNLQSIGISFCSRLKSLPDWMSKLTSLRQLSISSCSRRLERRCKDPHGEDWPCIQHIPKIQIRNCLY